MLRLALIERAFPLLGAVVKYGSYCFIAYFAFQALSQFAGESTQAALAFSYLTSEATGVTISISLTVNVMLYIWGRNEKKLRQSTVERLHGRIKELETQLDPKRSTSGLTARGTTHPNDV